MRAFAETDPGTDWRATADDTVNHAVERWVRASEGGTLESVFDDDADPIECWIEAITSPGVIIGQRLSMRSAWEGALAYRSSDWDATASQRAADSARLAAYERMMSDFSSQH